MYYPPEHTPMKLGTKTEKVLLIQLEGTVFHARRPAGKKWTITPFAVFPSCELLPGVLQILSDILFKGAMLTNILKWKTTIKSIILNLCIFKYILLVFLNMLLCVDNVYLNMSEETESVNWPCGWSYRLLWTAKREGNKLKTLVLYKISRGY